MKFRACPDPGLALPRQRLGAPAACVASASVRQVLFKSRAFSCFFSSLFRKASCCVNRRATATPDTCSRHVKPAPIRAESFAPHIGNRSAPARAWRCAGRPTHPRMAPPGHEPRDVTFVGHCCISSNIDSPHAKRACLLEVLGEQRL
jgi:hypothetical protein